MTEKTTAYVQYLFLSQRAECVPQSAINIYNDYMVEINADNGSFVFAIGDDDIIHDLDSADYDSIVEQTVDQIESVINTMNRTDTHFWAWDSVEQFIVELLEAYDLPLELTSHIMHHAMEVRDDNMDREIDLANNVAFSENYE